MKTALKPWARICTIAAVVLLSVNGSAQAQSGTLYHKTATFLGSGNATFGFAVTGPVAANTSTTLFLELGSDGNSTLPVADPLPSPANVNFVITTGGATATVTAQQAQQAGGSSGTGTIPNKTVNVTRLPDGLGLYMVTITHTTDVAFNTTEAWTVQVTGLPTVRGIASLDAALFSSLNPIGPCPTGGNSGGTHCPICLRCLKLPWPEILVDWPIIKPPRPGPCLSCPEPWNQRIPEDLVRTMVTFTAVNAEGQPIGPGHAEEIKVNVRDGELVPGVMDAGNGSYHALIQHRKGQPPSMSVTAAGYTTDEVRVAKKSEGGKYKTLTFVFALLFAITVVALIAQRRRSTQGV